MGTIDVRRDILRTNIHLSSVRSMVFRHIWWTNRIANADPDLLALCPLHLSIYGKDGKTH